MPLPPPVEPEIHEGDAAWHVGAPLSGQAISLPEGPNNLRAGPDGRMWLTLEKDLAAVTMAGAVARYAPPAGDRFDSFGFLGDGVVLGFLRKAKKVEFRDLAGQPDGRSLSLTSQMKFPRFQPGPNGTEWISSIRAARVIWVRPDGSHGSTEEQSSTGYAMTSDGLMWGMRYGFFALDAQGTPRHWINFERIGEPLATDDGALWFSDGPGPADGDDVPHRINRYDRAANVLQRWRLPAGWVPFDLCPAPGGEVAFVAYDGSAAHAGRFSKSGTATARRMEGGAQLLISIARDAAGKFWCADVEAKRLFRIAL